MPHRASLMQLKSFMAQQIFGQEQLIDRTLICLLAGGHLLVEGAPGLAIPLPSPTNIVYVDVPDAAAAVDRLRERSVWVLATGPRRIRVVFHLDIDDEGLETAIAAFRETAA